jgi:hypothetical protein
MQMHVDAQAEEKRSSARKNDVESTSTVAARQQSAGGLRLTCMINDVMTRLPDKAQSQPQQQYSSACHHVHHAHATPCACRNKQSVIVAACGYSTKESLDVKRARQHASGAMKRKSPLPSTT